MYSGSIKTFNKDKGFGFITPDDGSKPLFAHVKQNPDMAHCMPGDAVSYDKGKDERPGREWKNEFHGAIACNVTLLSDMEQAAWAWAHKARSMSESNVTLQARGGGGGGGGGRGEKRNHEAASSSGGRGSGSQRWEEEARGSNWSNWTDRYPTPKKMPKKRKQE